MNGERFQNIFLKKWRPYAFIIGIGLLVYIKTLSFGFVDYDDRHLIVTNHQFLSDLSNFFQVFLRDVFDVEFYSTSKSYYRPLLTISLMFDAQIGGISPFIYHLTNVIIHTAASCLLLSFLCNLGFRKDLSLFFSLVFAVHPVLTQAVAWIGGRNDSLLAVCILLSFLSFINLIEKKNLKYYFLHILFLLMALFAKETALAVIAMCLLYFFLIKKERPSFAELTRLLAGWLIVVSAWSLLRSIAVENPGITVLHIIKSIAVNSPGIIQYTGKIFMPVNLSVYPIMQDIPLIYGIAGIIIIATLLILSKDKRTGFVTFGLAWFILFLLPSLVSATPGPYSIFFEHRVYLPVIGLIMVVMETDIVKKLNFEKKFSLIVSALIIPVFSLITFNHSNAMRDPLSYWSNAASSSPSSPVAHLNLGDKYYAGKMLDKAEAEFRKALELDPAQPMAHNNLGRVYAVRGIFDRAEIEFKTELSVNPGYENALYNLGMLKYDQGMIKEAVNYWEQTLAVNPYNIKANRFLAYYFYNIRNFEKARQNIARLQKRGVQINMNHFRDLFSE